MILSERIKAVVDYSRLSVPKFAEFVGFKTPQAVRELLRGRTQTLSDIAALRLTTAFPRLNRRWLISGEGEMLLPDEPTTPAALVTQSPTLVNAGAHSRSGSISSVVSIGAEEGEVVRALRDEVADLRATVDSQRRQIDRLLSIIETMQAPPKGGGSDSAHYAAHSLNQKY